jgi:hypothetical protein
VRHTHSNENDICVSEFTTECLLTAMAACSGSQHAADIDLARKCEAELKRRELRVPKDSDRLIKEAA